MSDENFLSRWSRRKNESKVETAEPTLDVPVQPTSEARPVGPTEDVVAAEAQPLPPVESLTHESDFTPFMKAEVDPALKRDAFKKLIQDPRYNVMDGLDVYIDDYSKPDPLPEGWLEKMNQVKHLGIFQPRPEEVAGEVASDAAALQKPMEEQPLEPPAEAPPADTLATEVPPPGVGKPGTFGQGS